MKEYRWKGKIWQIADEDLHMYPDAEPVEAPKKEKKKTTKNKSRQTPKNK